MTALLWLAAVAGLLALAAAAATRLGERGWAAAMRVLQASLQAGRVDEDAAAMSPPTHYDAQELEGLPEPVQRYFRTVLREGQPIIRAVTIDLHGTFNLSPTGEHWKPFTSRQRVVTRRPGFLWDASIAMLPGLRVRVVDSYIAGRGLLHATLQGLWTLAKQEGGGEIARGEFMRWCAEMPWYPTALLPSQGVRWVPVDGQSAYATMVDGPLSVRLLFRFNEGGLIASFRAEARGSLVGDKMVMAPWEGVWSNYQSCDGMQLPFTGEVAWMRPEGRKPYFVGTVEALRFEFAA